MSAVYGVIRKLGATSKYKGYYYVVDAVEMAQKIYERPVKVTKDIYPVIARKYKSTPSNVEHNIHWKKWQGVQWQINRRTVSL